MKSFIDNSLLRKLNVAGIDSQEDLLEACAAAGFNRIDPNLKVEFGWASFLEMIGQGSLLEDLPTLDEYNDFFKFVLSALSKDPPKEFCIELYDRVFVECLTRIKALRQIQQAFLLDQIQQRWQNLSGTMFSSALAHYAKVLTEDPYNTLHDLTLYLAWDRLCVYVAVVFERLFPESRATKGLEIFKECLIESFQHITGQGRTTPGFFRFIETLYAYNMREENLHSHSEAEWLVLCQGAQALKPRESLSDVYYVDVAVVDSREPLDTANAQLRVFTADAPDKVEAALALTRCMIQKLKTEGADWHYTIRPVDVVCL